MARKSEVIAATIGSETFRKRVFSGQRFLTVLQKDEHAKPLIQAWHSRDKATQYAHGNDQRYMVEVVLEARVEGTSEDV